MLTLITVKEGIRSKTIQSSFIAIAFLTLFSAFLSVLSLDEPTRTFGIFAVFFIKLISLLSMLFLSLYSIYSDRERGTLQVYISHLKSRGSYLRGRILGFLLLYAGYIIASLILASAVAIAFKISNLSLLSKLLVSFPSIFLTFVPLISISCLFYVLLPSSLLINFALCLGIYLAGNLTTDAYIFISELKAPFLMRLVSKVVYYLLPNFTLIKSHELFSSVAYAISYSCAVLMLAESIFERSEIT